MLAIKPEQVVKRKVAIIPEFVLDAFNELIAKHWCSGCAKFTLKEAMAMVVAKAKAAGHQTMTSSEAFSNRWFDVEDIYRDSGWVVEFDQPGYCEDYPATYEFRVRGRGQ